MSLHGVGIDIADASRISRLLESAGDRFTGRWFTPEEIAQCDASADRAAAYALRFAAKEAVWKAVGGGVQGVPWRSIAILHDEDTQLLRVSLTGELGEVAERTGVGHLAVTVTLGECTAMAVAFAQRAQVSAPSRSA
jgi:phosphopantetheine--protein transferase-like protein